MEINYKNSHSSEEVTPEITDLAEKKLLSLKKYVHEGNSESQVYVEFGKVSEAHQQGNIWRTQINLDLNGKRYHADAVRETVKASLEVAIGELEKELHTAKQQHQNLIKRGGGALKSIMRGFNS